MALSSSSTLLMFGKEIRPCFGALLVVSGMGFSLVGSGSSLFHVGFVVPQMVMVIFLGDVPFPPLVEIRVNPEFHDLMRMDKGHWPRCLLRHGWVPMLSGVPGASPWAASAAESASHLVEAALGRYSSDLLAGWGESDECDEVEAASLMPDDPNVWTDGSLVPMSGLMVALSRIKSLSLLQVLGFLLTKLRIAGVVVGGVMLIVFALGVRFRLAGSSAPFLGLCSLFRELKCGVSFWLCSLFLPFIQGLTNLGVVRHVGRLLNGHHGSLVFELVKDGDFLLLIDGMLRLLGGLDTVRIAKVKGHADQCMVLDGRARQVG